MTCPNNIPGRQCLAGMRNTWLKKTITFPFIFRSMTIVRSLAANGNFSIHYSAGLHVVCHGTVAMQYQYLLPWRFLQAVLKKIPELSPVQASISPLLFPARWLALQSVSQAHTTCSYQPHCFPSHCCSLMIPILKELSSHWLKWRNHTLNDRGALNFHFKNCICC